MSGHRQAAVALHSLAMADRDAILVALPDSDQRTLRAYLDELSELGFDTGLQAVVELPRARSKQRRDQQECTAQERIQSAGAAQVLAVFEAEPASLLGQFLALHNWAWRDELLSMLAPARREQVRAAQPAALPPPELARYLIEAVAVALGDAAPPPEPSMHMKANRFLQRVRAWTR